MVMSEFETYLNYIPIYTTEVFKLFIEMSPYLILGFLISGILYIFISKEQILHNLGRGGIVSIVKAALFGVPMPLCSCGVIPVSSSLYNRGASKGATLSFLISTPQTGVDSILITAGGLGVPFAIIRVVVALITGVVGGLLSETTEIKDYETTSKIKHSHNKATTWIEGLKYGLISLPQDIIKPLFQGLFLAALVSTFLGDNFFNDFGLNGTVGLFTICLIAIPMYTCATASVPFAISLIHAGADPGIAFVFLMAGPATNIATMSVIKKIMGARTLYIYLATIFVSAIITGWLINQFMIDTTIANGHSAHEHFPQWIVFASTILLLAVSINALLPNFLQVKNKNIKNESSADLSLLVKGMTCNHCKETVHEAISSCIDDDDEIDIDLESGQTFIYGKNLDENKIILSINNSGFSVGKNT